MNITLDKSTISKASSIQITGSKSESNRLLLLQALYPKIILNNISNSDDSEVMMRALKSDEKHVDIHHAGTAMRFLTAYFAIQEGRETILTGSKRMKERPIKILVEALRYLGADITYLEKEGYPPLKITGKTWSNRSVSLKASVSSQYISALLLIAPKLKHGLELVLEGDITSLPYIKMTLNLLQQIGVDYTFEHNIITIQPLGDLQEKKEITVESDWSSASYYFSIIALSPQGTEVSLSSYTGHSLQGDALLVDIYKHFGVSTYFNANTITLRKENNFSKILNLDLKQTPDIAQTITVTCFVLGMSCYLTGLHTLKIKETDRLVALKTEIEKLGGTIEITESTLRLLERNQPIKENISIATYDDHRMAMAFAPLAFKVPVVIKDAKVVSKSYPTFWEDLRSLGFKVLS